MTMQLRLGGTGLRKYYVKLINNADKFDFPIYKPYNQLSKNELNILWEEMNTLVELISSSNT